MARNEILTWLKVFIPAFILFALVRMGFEMWLLGSVESYPNVGFFALIVAVAIATAQWVLRPRLRPTPILSASVSATASIPLATPSESLILAEEEPLPPQPILKTGSVASRASKAVRSAGAKRAKSKSAPKKSARKPARRR